jgi:hypothetical protein
MAYKMHEFDRYANIRAVLADSRLVPELPAADDGPAGASVAWLRATVARFSSGDPHRRRALVEAELVAVLERVTGRRDVDCGSGPQSAWAMISAARASSLAGNRAISAASSDPGRGDGPGQLPSGALVRLPHLQRSGCSV